MYATITVLPIMSIFTLVCNLLELPITKLRLTRLTKPPDGMVGGRRVLFYSLLAASLMGSPSRDSASASSTAPSPDRLTRCTSSLLLLLLLGSHRHLSIRRLLVHSWSAHPRPSARLPCCLAAAHTHVLCTERGGVQHAGKDASPVAGG